MRVWHELVLDDDDTYDTNANGMRMRLNCGLPNEKHMKNNIEIYT